MEDPDRFGRILRLFEKAVAREEKEHLQKKAMNAFCEYLWKQHDYQRAIPLTERYKKYMELEGSQAEIAAAYSNMGIL